MDQKLNKSILLLIGGFAAIFAVVIVIFLGIQRELGIRQQMSVEDPVDTPVNNPDNQQQSSDNNLEFQIIEPKRYDAISIGEPLRVELNARPIQQVQVYVTPSASFCERDQECLSEFQRKLERTSVGSRSLNRGYIEIDTTSFNPGQYLVELESQGKILARSPEVALVTSKNRLIVNTPFEGQEFDPDTMDIQWKASPDIFYLNLVVESDTERRYIARDIHSQTRFSWDKTDVSGRVFEPGSYVLVVENAFSQESLQRIRFQLVP